MPFCRALSKVLLKVLDALERCTVCVAVGGYEWIEAASASLYVGTMTTS